jgi:hypothetical protein
MSEEYQFDLEGSIGDSLLIPFMSMIKTSRQYQLFWGWVHIRILKSGSGRICNTAIKCAGTVVNSSEVLYPQPNVCLSQVAWLEWDRSILD